MEVFIIIGIIILILVLMYNSLIGRKNEVENIFSSMDTALKKRFDLIPNLVQSVSKYMDHERKLLEKVTELRSSAMKPNISQSDKMSIDKQLTSTLGSIMVAVENYPELKANENMIHLQRTLHEVEAQIAAARRAYNQTVTDYNNAIEMFPSNLMAKAMKYSRKDVYEIDEIERENINVKEIFETT